MTSAIVSDEFTFDKNREYRIVVQGSLDDSWSSRLGGMRIDRNIQAGQEPVTTLTGMPKAAELLTLADGPVELEVLP